MTAFDRFAWWVSKPSNCNKVLAVAFGVFAAVWWLTGEWSPLPLAMVDG